MKTAFKILTAIVFVIYFDGMYDKILLWLYSNDDFLSQGIRFIVAFMLLQSMGMFSMFESEKTAELEKTKP